MDSCGQRALVRSGYDASPVQVPEDVIGVAVAFIIAIGGETTKTAAPCGAEWPDTDKLIVSKIGIVLSYTSRIRDSKQARRTEEPRKLGGEEENSRWGKDCSRRRR